MKGNNMSCSASLKKGLSLIEIMVVVFIMGLFLTWAIPKVMKKQEQGQVTRAQTDIVGIEGAIRDFYQETGTYPEQLANLVDASTVTDERVRSKMSPDGYLEKNKLPKDPWNNEYQYQVEGGQFKVYSWGPRGEGAEDEAKRINAP